MFNQAIQVLAARDNNPGEGGKMKLWVLSQTVNGNYDTYDSAVVAASDADKARAIHPNGVQEVTDKTEKWGTWCVYDDVVATYIGETDIFEEGAVICSSFNAG